MPRSKGDRNLLALGERFANAANKKRVTRRCNIYRNCDRSCDRALSRNERDEDRRTSSRISVLTRTISSSRRDNSSRSRTRLRHVARLKVTWPGLGARCIRDEKMFSRREESRGRYVCRPRSPSKHARRAIT